MFGTTSCRGMMAPNRSCESSRVISPLAELNAQLYLKVIEFTQQDVGKKRTVKCLCVTNVTWLFQRVLS